MKVKTETDVVAASLKACESNLGAAHETIELLQMELRRETEGHQQTKIRHNAIYNAVFVDREILEAMIQLGGHP